MKAFVAFAVALIGGLTTGGTVDVYRIEMNLQVPRTYDNMKSTGYRKYQAQWLKGEMRITYGNGNRAEISITNLVNLTHRIGGKNITYDTSVDEWFVEARVNLIGDNESNEFRTPSVVFFMDAEPSYNVGEDDEDNSLLGILAAKGTTVKVNEYREERRCGRMVKVKVGEYRRINRLSGNFSGTLGCGCSAYGHVSPTRVAGARGATEEVDDVAAAWGTWTARFVRRETED